MDFLLQDLLILLQKQLEIDIRFFQTFFMTSKLSAKKKRVRPVKQVDIWGTEELCGARAPFFSSFFSFYHIFIIVCNFYKYMMIMIHFHGLSVSYIYIYRFFPYHRNFRAFHWRFIQNSAVAGQAWQLDLKRPCMAVSLAELPPFERNWRPYRN